MEKVYLWAWIKVQRAVLKDIRLRNNVCISARGGEELTLSNDAFLSNGCRKGALVVLGQAVLGERGGDYIDGKSTSDCR